MNQVPSIVVTSLATQSPAKRWGFFSFSIDSKTLVVLCLQKAAWHSCDRSPEIPHPQTCQPV